MKASTRTSTSRGLRTALLALALAGTFAAAGSWSATAQDNSNVAGAVQKKLDSKNFQNVKVTVDQSGIATLTGSVDLYEYKMEADKKTHKVKGVTGVRNDIEVAGPSVSDAQLKQELGEKLAYDPTAYGHTFDAITIGVHDGVVTLGGHVHNYVNRDSALALASTFPGVKEVNDEMQVDPTSIMDDQTRLRVARAVYGSPTLQKYAINPAQPIRISVQNGHVELAGVVDSKADKETAYIRASQVPGIFSVQNDLQVAGEGAIAEKQTK